MELAGENGDLCASLSDEFNIGIIFLPVKPYEMEREFILTKTSYDVQTWKWENKQEILFSRREFVKFITHISHIRTFPYVENLLYNVCRKYEFKHIFYKLIDGSMKRHDKVWHQVMALYNIYNQPPRKQII